MVQDVVVLLLLLLLLRGKEWGSWELGASKRGARVWAGHGLQDSDAIRGRRSRPLQHLLLHHGHHLHVLLHSLLDGVENRFLWVLAGVCAGSWEREVLERGTRV